MCRAASSSMSRKSTCDQSSNNGAGGGEGAGGTGAGAGGRRCGGIHPEAHAELAGRGRLEVRSRRRSGACSAASNSEVGVQQRVCEAATLWLRLRATGRSVRVGAGPWEVYGRSVCSGAVSMRRCVSAGSKAGGTGGTLSRGAVAMTPLLAISVRYRSRALLCSALMRPLKEELTTGSHIGPSFSASWRYTDVPKPSLRSAPPSERTVAARAPLQETVDHPGFLDRHANRCGQG